MSHRQSPIKYWGVMPAAGVGTRMQLDYPKQYLKVAGKTILEHSIAALLTHPRIESLVVCLSPDDGVFPSLNIQDNRVVTALGGAERSDSVLNGLMKLKNLAAEDDWVLVHDAARPCLQVSSINRLVEQLEGDSVGGILALKAKDTLKQASVKASLPSSDIPEVCQTLDRNAIWQAQTPQMFRYGVLLSALRYCADHELTVTDEASALEHKGHAVKLIEGSAQNIKVTTPEDQRLAEFLLSQR